MEVVDLTEEHKPLYFVCLEDWSDEIKEAGDHKERWYRRMKDKGLRVKLALDDRGEIGGMIEYLPIEHAPAEGTDLHFITCIWVHGYKQGRGDFRKRGMGKALLAAAEEDARGLGTKGMVAFGLWLPFWMRASWFKKHGYKKTDTNGLMQLLWKPFAEDAERPKWIKRKYAPDLTPGKVTVTSFLDGRCPAQSLAHERALRAAQELGDKVAFHTIDTCEKETVRQYGQVTALYVDGKKVRTGPPPSYEKLHKIIAKRVKKLK